MIPRTKTYRVIWRDKDGHRLMEFDVRAPTRLLARLELRDAMVDAGVWNVWLETVYPHFETVTYHARRRNHVRSA